MSAEAPLIILTAQRAWVYRKYPPFGIMYVAAALQDAGFRVKIIHPVKDRLEEIRRAVRQERPLFVGLSVIYTPLLAEDIEISRALKGAEVPVVWGGVYPSMLPETSLAADYVDHIVTGEAEESVVDLARALASGKVPEGVPGVGWKSDGGMSITPCASFHDDLDRFRPAWDLIRLQEYLEIYSGGVGRMAMVPLSRGCPFRCAFCYNQSNPDRRRYRIHGPEWVLAQVDLLKRKVAANMVRWIGDNPFGSVKRGQEIVEAAGMPWVAASRIEIMSEEFCEWMQKTACQSVGFGFESGSEKVLKILNKQITREQMVRGIRNLDRAGLFSSVNWIHLIPGESEDDRRETRRFMDELYAMSSHVFHEIQGLKPYPDTPIWEKCLEMGMKPPITNEDWARYDNLVAHLFGWSEQRLERLVIMTRLLYGRARTSPPLVPSWQLRMFRRRFIKGKFSGPLEEWLKKRPVLKPHLADS